LNQQKLHFVVIGRNVDDVEAELPSNISFAGFLPKREDFDAYLKYADIALLPFPKQAVAGGARNKALDYFASKTLVISTPEGLRGLEEFHHLKHLLLTGYSSSEIADVILDAAKNLDKYQPFTEAAYTLIRDKYSWSAKAKNVASILMTVNNLR
jgi:glycosyltransferase involved in cell wall biosynthesis